jgi:hypothetical protein
VRPRWRAAVEPATGATALLALALLPFVPYVIGVLRYDWGFNELSALVPGRGLRRGLVADTASERPSA